VVPEFVLHVEAANEAEEVHPGQLALKVEPGATPQAGSNGWSSPRRSSVQGRPGAVDGRLQADSRARS
jgi:hypothetical protein